MASPSAVDALHWFLLITRSFDVISMSPASIGPVKAMLTELPVGELTTFFEENLAGHAAGLDPVSRSA